MEDRKALTIATYNRDAAALTKRYSDLQRFRLDDIDEFLEAVPGKRILELGAGPGVDSEYMQINGFEVLATDLSDAMLAISTERGLTTKKVDLEHIDFAAQSFDGVYAAACFLHLTKAAAIRSIEAVANILVPHGVFFISLKKGTGETVEGERFFSYWEEGELHSVLNRWFTIEHHYIQQEPGQAVWLKAFCRKRTQ